MNEIDEKIKEVCDRIKKLRNSRNMHQNELATILGIDRTTVSRMEAGIIKPNLGHLLIILHHFNVSLNWLFLGQGEMYENPLSFEFGGNKEDVIEMVEAMQRNKALMHSILSKYHTEKIKYPQEKENSKDAGAGND